MENRGSMKEPGVSSLSGLILDKNKSHGLNLKKSRISVEYGGRKCPLWEVSWSKGKG